MALTLCGVARAQSTLEYVTLTGSMAAAAKASKGKAQNQSPEGSQVSSAGVPDFAGGAMAKLYSENSQVMSSKAGSLLGQAGGGILSRPPRPASTPETAASSQETSKVYLKSGRVVQGKIAEEKDDYIKMDLDGITVTFFKEEIGRIERSSGEK